MNYRIFIFSSVLTLISSTVLSQTDRYDYESIIPNLCRLEKLQSACETAGVNNKDEPYSIEQNAAYLKIIQTEISSLSSEREKVVQHLIGGESDESPNFDGVHEDVLPDIIDQPVINQQIFMRYFSQYTQSMSEEDKIDFGFDLSDITRNSVNDIDTGIEYLTEFELEYSVDLSALSKILDLNQAIGSVNGAIISNNTAKTSEEIAQTREEIAQTREEIAQTREEIARIEKQNKRIEKIFRALLKKEPTKDEEK